MNPDHPADFYTDPRQPGQLRYWDGHQWTDQVKEDPHANHGRPQDRVRILSANEINDDKFDPDNPTAHLRSGLHEARTVHHNLGSVLLIVMSILILCLGVYLFIIAGQGSQSAGDEVKSSGQSKVEDQTSSKPLTAVKEDESSQSQTIRPFNGSRTKQFNQMITDGDLRLVMNKVLADLQPGRYLRIRGQYANNLLQCKDIAGLLKDGECIAFVTPTVKTEGLMFEGLNSTGQYQQEEVARDDLIRITIRARNQDQAATGKCLAYIKQNRLAKITGSDVVCK